MKRIFGRDKPKITKVTPASREIVSGSGQAPVLEDQPQYPHAHHQHQTAREAVLQQQQSMGRSSSDEHWEVVAPYREDVNYHQQPQPRDPKIQSPRPPALTASRSSSMASLPGLPPGASPPIPSPMQAPRSASPFTISSNATTVREPRSERPRQGEKDAVLKKRPQMPGTGPGSPPSAPTSTAALGILRALDPFAALDAPTDKEHRSHRLHHDRHHSDEALHEEKKEKKGFWGGKEKEKEKGRERRDDDGQAELTRMIGYLTATASEDWSLVLEVCDRASASEANAKEAVKALRREFKYAEPSAQLSAARLWAIMLRNSSEIFMQQIMSKKFLDTLEDVLTSPRTSPVVRERLMDVLAAVAYASGSKHKSDPRAEKEGFRGLWRRLKPADKPDEGVPFDIDDAMFNPPMPRPTSGYSVDPEEYFNQQFSFSQAPTEQQAHEREMPPPPHPPRKSSMRRKQHRIIPPEEDMRRLFQECKIGQGNANLLSEALRYARPEDLVKKDIIKEFYAKCRSSQELIYAQIPWASAGAERSRQGNPPRAVNGSYPNLLSREDESPTALTVEEELLAALLAANEALLEALRLYDDLERVAVEREAEEISRRDVRMDRRQLQYQDNEYGGQLEAPQAFVGGSSSRTPSPSPTDSPAISFQQPAYIPSITHPLPRIPLSGHTSNSSSTHLSAYSTQNAALLPPPPAPHGPRSPAQNHIPSRTPSPDRYNSPPAPDHHSRTDSSASSRDYHAMRNGLSGLQIGQSLPRNDDDDDEVSTPIKPSAKALGKRKVVEVEEPDRAFDTDDMFYENRDEPYPVESRPDSDSDDVGGMWNHTTHYVYDAAAERTQQRLRRGRVSTLVDGVH